MKVWFGTPGMTSGLVLRVFQFLFASASIAVMSSSTGFASSTSFCYLIAAMGLQVLWSFALACLDIHALRVKKDLHSHMLLSLVVVGDWVTAILALAASSSAAGVMVLLVRDSDLCKLDPKISCSTFQISIALAFMSWFLLAVSSHTAGLEVMCGVHFSRVGFPWLFYSAFNLLFEKFPSKSEALASSLMSD